MSHTVGATGGGTATDHLGGAPIVDEDAGDGTVARFFQLASVEMFKPLGLDEIIDRGWDLH